MVDTQDQGSRSASPSLGNGAFFSWTPKEFQVRFLPRLTSASLRDQAYPSGSTVSKPFSLSSRRVLSDITPSTLNTNPSTLAALHARSARTITSSTRLHDKVVGYQHRRCTIKRRNAISLSKEQADRLAGSLSCLGAGEEREEKEEEEKDVRAVGGGWTTEWHTVIPLHSNVFFVTRTDGHALGCRLGSSKVHTSSG